MNLDGTGKKGSWCQWREIGGHFSANPKSRRRSGKPRLSSTPKPNITTPNPPPISSSILAEIPYGSKDDTTREKNGKTLQNSICHSRCNNPFLGTFRRVLPRLTVPLLLCPQGEQLLFQPISTTGKGLVWIRTRRKVNNVSATVSHLDFIPPSSANTPLSLPTSSHPCRTRARCVMWLSNSHPTVETRLHSA